MKYIISEPLPVYSEKRITIEEVPDKVLASFVRARPTATIKDVRAYTFKRVTKYDFSFHDNAGYRHLKVDSEGQILWAPNLPSR